MYPLVLLQAHTHADKTFQAGERLDVDARTADWLIANGIARITPKPDPKPKPPRKEPQP